MLMADAGSVQAPSTAVRRNQGRPSENRMAIELEPNELDTPTPPLPGIGEPPSEMIRNRSTSYLVVYTPLRMMMMQAIASGRQEPQQRMVRPMTTSGMPKVSPMTTIIQKIRYELTPIKTMHMTKDSG